jgi:hypothetical protein
LPRPGKPCLKHATAEGRVAHGGGMAVPGIVTSGW